jgi:hypothetical protein
MAHEYNTKVEGHRGEAARLEQHARWLLAPAAVRKEIAAELKAKADVHWKAAQDAAFQTYGFEMVEGVDVA